MIFITILYDINDSITILYDLNDSMFKNVIFLTLIDYL